MNKKKKYQNSDVRVSNSCYNSSRFGKFSFSFVFRKFSLAFKKFCLVCLEVGFLGLFGGCVCGFGLTTVQVQGALAYGF